MVHGFVAFAVVASPAADDATNRGLAALKKALHSVRLCMTGSD